MFGCSDRRYSRPGHRRSCCRRTDWCQSSSECPLTCRCRIGCHRTVMRHRTSDHRRSRAGCLRTGRRRLRAWLSPDWPSSFEGWLSPVWLSSFEVWPSSEFWLSPDWLSSSDWLVSFEVWLSSFEVTVVDVILIGIVGVLSVLEGRGVEGLGNLLERTRGSLSNRTKSHDRPDSEKHYEERVFDEACAAISVLGARRSVNDVV